MLIDEWQIISFIWDSIKTEIDNNDSFGQFILTGSVSDQTILANKKVTIEERHSDTGRIVRKVMRTMSLFESGESNGEISLLDLKKAS